MDIIFDSASSLEYVFDINNLPELKKQNENKTKTTALEHVSKSTQYVSWDPFTYPCPIAMLD